MSSLEKSDAVTTPTVRYRMPGVHPEGRKFVVIAAAITLFFWVVVEWESAGWLFAGLTLWVAAFFRDPIRTTPKGEGLIVAPADGMVTMIAMVPPPPELVGRRISTIAYAVYGAAPLDRGAGIAERSWVAPDSRGGG